MKKATYWLCTLLAVTLIVSLVLSACAQPAPAPAPAPKPAPAPEPDRTGWPKQVTFACASAKSSWCILSTGVGGMVIKYLGIPSTGQPSAGGGNTNVYLIHRGEVEGGQATSLTTGDAAKGAAGSFKDIGVPKIRLFMTGHASAFHIMVMANSDIQTLYDLKGKRWIGRRPGSSTIDAYMDAVLETHGFTMDDVKQQKYTDSSELTAAINEGTADMCSVPSGIPQAQLLEFAMTKDVRLISMGEKERKAIMEKEPGFVEVTIPAGTFKGQDKDAECLAFTTQWIVQRDLPESFVYELFKMIFERFDEFEAFHKAAKEYSIDNSTKALNIPLHSGVIKYLKEKGKWTSELEAKQKALLAKIGEAK